MEVLGAGCRNELAIEEPEACVEIRREAKPHRVGNEEPTGERADSKENDGRPHDEKQEHENLDQCERGSFETKEEKRPERVQRELRPPERERHRVRGSATPNQPTRHRDSQIEQRPNRSKDPIGGRERRPLERRVPASGFEVGAEPSRPCDQQDKKRKRNNGPHSRRLAPRRRVLASPMTEKTDSRRSNVKKATPYRDLSLASGVTMRTTL